MILDSTDSMIRKMRENDKIDPGTFSIMEPGWWALHAAAITSVYLLGRKLHNHHHH